MKRKSPLRRYVRPPQRAVRDPQRLERDRLRARTPDAPPSQKWTAWRNRNREGVTKRSWRCESIEPCALAGTQVHHPFGRIGEPWASASLIGLNLCMDHHNRVTGMVGSGLDVVLRDRLRLLSLSRLLAYLSPRIREVRVLGVDMIRMEPPRAAYERLIAFAQSAGVQPPGWREA